MPTINQGLSAALTPSPPPHDAKLVLHRLREAGQTLLALPSNAPQLGVKTQALGLLADLADVWAGNRPRNRRPLPEPAAIDRMDRTLTWLSLIPDEQRVLRQIVALRLLVKPGTDRHLHSWRDIGHRLRCSHEAARAWHCSGIDLIVDKLNRQVLPRQNCIAA